MRSIYKGEANLKKKKKILVLRGFNNFLIILVPLRVSVYDCKHRYNSC
jgi:hypothetical protein